MNNDAFYNKLELNPPPNLSFKICCKTPEVASKKINDVFVKAINILKSQSSLHHESATLSRLIYRWKWLLRGDKGVKALRKVNKSLLQYRALDLVSILEKAHGTFSEDYGPSKQIMEWVLVRLQGFCKLFDNTYNRCMEAAKYLQLRIQNGHFWMIALIGTAVVSRIWVISVYLIKECCEWYSELKQMLSVLQPSLQPWLPSGYELPEDLTAWLGYPDYLVKHHDFENNAFHDILNKTKCMDSDKNILANKVENYLQIENNIDSPKEDIGEVVARHVSSNSRLTLRDNKVDITEEDGDSHFDNGGCTNGKIRKKTMSTDSANTLTSIIKNITSRDKLVKFLNKEKKIRKLNGCNDNGECFTRKLDKMQWRMFEKYIKDKVGEIDKHPAKRKRLLSNVKKEIKQWLS